MKRNVGRIDRAIRIIIGLLIIAAAFYFKSWWGLLAIIPLATAFTGRCGLYKLIGISTCKLEQ
ncbi:MAG: DUF2892 domain-containing protein [Bacteroidales bacterium]|jgi:hypothetical protein